MKILLVNNHFSRVGGAEIFTYNLGNLLKKNNQEVFYFATDLKPYFEPDYEYAKFFPQYIDYVNSSKIDLIKAGFSTFYNIEAEQKMKLMLDKVQPDIVHIHCIFYKLTPSILKPCYERNIPVVMTLHGPQFMCPSIKMMYRSEVYCKDELCISGNPIHCIINKCTDKSIMKSIGMTGEYLFRKKHGLYDKISLFITPSQALRELAIRAGFDSSKVVCINNFAVDEMLNIEPSYKNLGYFLFASRLSKEKGVEDLLYAMKKLPKEVKLLIIGTGPHEDFLKKLAIDLELENVEFLGFKTGDELNALYKNCIATVLPCNWFENFPTTIIESFAHGKPVIATRIGGIPEMVEDYKTGITVGLKNIEEMAEAINRLNKDKELVVSMGQNARQKAVENYASSVHYKKLIQIYSKFVPASKFDVETPEIYDYQT